MRLNHLLLRGLLSVVVGLLLASVAVGQSIVTGAITGAVTDPSGAIVSEATVTLKDPATGQVTTLTTNTSGIYQFSLLKPGVYVVTVSHTGFKQTTESVEAKVGNTTCN